MFKVVILIAKSDLLQNEFDGLMPLVSAEKQKRIKKFRFFQDAQNCLLGDVLARTEICRATGLDNSQLRFSTNTYGKPFLINNDSIHFNISHTGFYVACVVADEPVGIDIEIIKPIELKIAERFFTSDEAAYVMDRDYICRFYEVWTKKESHIKCEGQGLGKPLTSFSVFEINEKRPLFYHKVFQNEKAVCHVCSAKKAPPSIRVIGIDTFIQSVR